MTSLDASPEGSALGPDGWVAGLVRLEGPRIKAIEGRKLPKGATPQAPYVIPGSTSP